MLAFKYGLFTVYPGILIAVIGGLMGMAEKDIALICIGVFAVGILIMSKYPVFQDAKAGPFMNRLLNPPSIVLAVCAVSTFVFESKTVSNASISIFVFMMLKLTFICGYEHAQMKKRNKISVEVDYD